MDKYRWKAKKDEKNDSESGSQIITKKPDYLRDVNFLKFRDNFVLPVSTNGDWPSAAELKLDLSQYQAFKSALTQNLSKIEGPPGTGKTFLALLIVQALLENKKHWIHHGPIVFVAQSNHTLDKSIEKFINYTESTMYLGGESSNKKLQPYSLAERRNNISYQDENSELFRLKMNFQYNSNDLEKFRLYIKYLTTPDCIVPIQTLRYCKAQEPLKSFNQTQDLVKWLTGIQNYQSTQNSNPENSPVYPLLLLHRKIETIKTHICQLDIDSAVQHMSSSSIMKENIKQLIKLQTFIKQQLSFHPLIHPHPTCAPVKDQRWKQYWDWVAQSYTAINKNMVKLKTTVYELKSSLIKARPEADLAIIKKHEVLALTSAYAEKIHRLLQAICAPILLVEEGTEIPDHLLAVVSKNCQQVILMSNYKPLCHKLSMHESKIKHNLNVSLFERMVNIRGKCAQLEHQHRMRPEIAKLVSPIYDTLYNHESVYKYPNVKGLDGKNLFFLHHESHEESHHVDDSWINKHEVEFFSVFAKHLLMQGYSPDDITILCTYTGQMFAFMNETEKHSLLGKVRVTTVDNFQGEENKIILLSLVRNNGEGNIGFLREENRVCDALSRAREGLYIMGNMNDLLANNDIWPKIKKILEDENAIGDLIKLKCQIHQDQIFQVKNAKDFKQCPEGGCLKKCDLLLSCGHSCTNICHMLDREHKRYQCKTKCSKKCINNHSCQLLCFEECQCLVEVERILKCGHTVNMPCSEKPDKFACPIKVDIKLPLCGHATKKPCYLSVEKVQCDYDCDIRLDCGHACVNKCHANADPDHLEYKCLKDCTKSNMDCVVGNHMCRKKCFEKCDPCPVLIDKVRSCRHYFKKVQCSLKIDYVFCDRKCNRSLRCGHKCLLKCSDKCGNCSVMVKKNTSCGHCIKIKCCEEATPLNCNNNCKKTLSCGHSCSKKCKEPCSATTCEIMVPLAEPGACGHIFSVPCFLKNSDPKSRKLIKYCEEPCKFKLACTHECKGDCRSCFQGRIHVPCSEPCSNIFICGHACTTACNQECQPCVKKCELKCLHNKCGKNCGIPCVPCKEKCQRNCIHQICTKLCYEICNVKPCNVSCDKILKCGHACVGFCGDPCPPLCRICDKKKLTEIFLGNEDDSDARFVYLPDCQHVIENNGLMEWIKPLTTDESVEIKISTCPRCKTPIMSCLRLMDHVKENLKNVIAVKSKIFFNSQTNLKERFQKYVDELENIEKESSLQGLSNFRRYIQSLKNRSKQIIDDKKQHLSFNQVNTLKNILDLILEISSLLKKIRENQIFVYYIKIQIDFLTQSFPEKLQFPKQRLEDIQLEMRRLHLMVQVYNVYCQDRGLVQGHEYNILIQSLTKITRFTAKFETKIISSSQRLTNQNKQNALIERNNIVEAMGLQQKSWHLCPNGHLYTIGECGRAMQRSVCIECKAPVGGENHRLDPSNKPAMPHARSRRYHAKKFDNAGQKKNSSNKK